MKNLQSQTLIKNNRIYKKSYKRFWSGACLFLSIFLLPVSVAASAIDAENTFMGEIEQTSTVIPVNNSNNDNSSNSNSTIVDNAESDSTAPSHSDYQTPDSNDTSSDLDGFFSGDDTSGSSKDKTIHVIIENGNSSDDISGNGSAITDPGADSGTISGGGYTDSGSEGYSGGSSGSASSGEVILHKPQLLLEDSNLSSQSLKAGSTQEMSATFRNKSRSQNVFGLKISLSTETKGIEFAKNSFYVQRLTPGEAITLKSAITIVEDTEPGPVTVTFALEYEDSKATAATGTESLTFNIMQQLRAELEATDIPSIVYTMDTIEIPVKAMNLGRDKLYNAKVRLEAAGLSPSGTVFLGNIEPGTAAEGSMKIYVKGKTNESNSLTSGSTASASVADTDISGDSASSASNNSNETTATLSPGQISGRFLLTYEDSSGNSYETSTDFLTELKESQIQSLKVEEDQTQTNSWWYSILAVGALFLICIILLLLVSLRRKSVLLEEARKAASQ